MSVDLDISLAEEAIKTLEWQIKNLGDDWDNLQTKIVRYGSMFEKEMGNINTYKKGIADILGLTLEDEKDVDALLNDP